MNLRKFALLAVMFTTASGISVEPVTAIASNVVSAGTVLEDSTNMEYTAGTAGAGDSIYVTGADTSYYTDVTDITIPGMADADNSENKDETSITYDEEVLNNKAIRTKKKTVKHSSKKVKKTNKKTARSKSKKNYTSSDLRLMSSIINCEAGIEPYQGKLAVGIVVMNRIKSKSFPNSLKGVIYQSGQFSPVRNGSLNRRLSQYDSGSIKSKQWKSCISAAKKVLNGQRTISYNGRTKNMSTYHFFSVGLRGARFSLGGHKFK